MRSHCLGTGCNIERIALSLEDGKDNNPAGFHQVEDQASKATQHWLSRCAAKFGVERRAGNDVVKGAIDFGTELAAQVGKSYLVPFDRLLQLLTCFRTKGKPAFFHGRCLGPQ